MSALTLFLLLLLPFLVALAYDRGLIKKKHFEKAGVFVEETGVDALKSKIGRRLVVVVVLGLLFAAFMPLIGLDTTENVLKGTVMTIAQIGGLVVLETAVEQGVIEWM